MDTLIFATGFDTVQSMANLKISRRGDGRLLHELWGDCPNAYNGIMYPGFPNVFFLLGPNTVLGKYKFL